MGPFRLASRAWRNTVVAFAIVLLVLWHLALPDDRSISDISQCPEDSGADNLVVLVKTGATEALERIPALMHTTLRCQKHVLFFSDLDQDLGPYRLHDALDNVLPSVMENSDFDFYREQRKIWNRDGNISILQEVMDPRSPSLRAAWTLDKYKFMHILEKAWTLQPDMDWYLLMDADTYIIWSNFLRWLPSLNPLKKSWYGSRVFLGGIPFSHGGSGTLLSRSTVYDFVVTHNGTANQWDPLMHSECCGDYLLGKALTEYGNVLGNVHPSMEGHSPASIPFLDEYWCEPTVTLHHMSPSTMAEFQAFEQDRPDQSLPITHAEIFATFVREPLQSRTSPRENWDNFSGKFELGSGLSGGEDEKVKTGSVDECTAACEANKACFQYGYDGETCYIGKCMRLGERREPENGKVWQSGWHQDRIADWISRQKTCSDRNFPAFLGRNN